MKEYGGGGGGVVAKVTSPHGSASPYTNPLPPRIHCATTPVRTRHSFHAGYASGAARQGRGSEGGGQSQSESLVCVCERECECVQVCVSVCHAKFHV